MQPTEGFNVQRRPMDVEDYIDIVRRHKGWIFGPFLFTLVAAVVGVYLAPDTYVSQAVVKIVPQQVPTSMVQSAVTQQMSDRINSMAQTILSRTTLTTIINTFGLYPRERAREPIDDVIEEMRKKVEIVPVAVPGSTSSENIPAFIVRFSYENRYMAQRVVQDLVGRFIDENTRNRSNATIMTTQFLTDQVDSAKKELYEAETKLAAFRMQNNGHLPDQADANLRQLQALQGQVTYLDAQISRANQDKLQIDANLRIYKDQLASMTKETTQTTAAAAQKSQELSDTERDIQKAESDLAILREHYKETFPDVRATQERLNAAKKRRDAILAESAKAKENSEKEEPAPKPVNAQASKEARDLDATIRRLQTAMDSKDLEIQEYNKEMKHASEAIKSYQARLETVPLGEKQYTDLLQDQAIAKAKYLDMSDKLQRAEVAQEMEGRKQGETLELLDPASLPTNPSEPKRPMIIGMGAGLGLFLGIVIAGAREMKDTSLKNLKDVRAYTKMNILGSVPLLENDFVVRRRRRLAWLGWTTACLAAVVITSGSIVYYYVTKV